MPSIPTPSEDTPGRWQRAAIAALAQLGAGELLAALLPGAGSPLAGVGQTLIDLTPGPGVDVVVATLQSRDKAALRAGVVGSIFGLARVAAAPAGGPVLLLGTGVLAGAATAIRPANSTAPSLAAGTGGGIAAAAALARLTADADAHRVRTGAPIAPRRLLFAGAAALGTAQALRHRRRAQAQRERAALTLPRPARPAPPLPAGAELEVPGLSPLLTPAERFYVTDAAAEAPIVDPARWRLRVHGRVEHELELSLDELFALEAVELDATLVCVHNPTGGDRISSARWLGVPLRAVLDRAGVLPGADQVLTGSVDGFTAGLPLELATQEPFPLIAFGLNGEPLRPGNGFPARLLTPWIWGADANTKWLSSIELTTWERMSDYWDSRGWPRTPGQVTPGSRIDVPADRAALPAGPALAAGVAWAPRHGVTGVEVSIDGGTWQEAELSAAVAPTLWRQWSLPWLATPGGHELRVRARSGDETQVEAPAPPYPHGSSGLHTIRVTVAAPGVTVGRVRPVLRAGAAELRGRIRLAAMAPPAWRRRGFPGPPALGEALPPARRGGRALLPSAGR